VTVHEEIGKKSLGTVNSTSYVLDARPQHNKHQLNMAAPYE